MGLMERLRPAKKVPTVWWSSSNPTSVRPRPSTLAILVTGEFIFGLGDSFLIAAGIGNTPWTVLAEGISYSISSTIGEATFLVSVAVLPLMVAAGWTWKHGEPIAAQDYLPPCPWMWTTCAPAQN